MPSSTTIDRTQAEIGDQEVQAPRRRAVVLRVPTMGTVFAVGFAVLIWVTKLTPLHDNSFLWHLKTGHWILEHGIPRADIFSFTAPGTPWVAQSWLAEVFYAVLDNLFGPFGIQVVRAGVAALSAYLLFRLAARVGGDRTRAVYLTFAALTGSFGLWVERPLLFGVLAMVVLLWVVEVPESLVGRHPYISLSALLWVWVNVHGTFALGFVYLGLHVVGRWLDGSPPWAGRERRLVQATVVALACCLVNPYGVDLLLFPLHLLARGEMLKNVKEWQSPDFQSLHGVLFAVWIVTFVITLAVSRQRASRRDVLVSVFFLALGLWALRNAGLAPLIGLPIAVRLLPAREERPDERKPFHWVALAGLFLIGLIVAVGAAGGEHYALDDYPVEAMQVVEREGLLGRELATTDAWGAYVIH
ncbi:MAG TPA: hypothetical protein VGL92_16570, partial [Acidimicrobiia bacterium]